MRERIQRRERGRIPRRVLHCSLNELHIHEFTISVCVCVCAFIVVCVRFIVCVHLCVCVIVSPMTLERVRKRMEGGADGLKR